MRLISNKDACFKEGKKPLEIVGRLYVIFKVVKNGSVRVQPRTKTSLNGGTIDAMRPR